MRASRLLACVAGVMLLLVAICMRAAFLVPTSCVRGLDSEPLRCVFRMRDEDASVSVVRRVRTKSDKRWRASERSNASERRTRRMLTFGHLVTLPEWTPPFKCERENKQKK